MYDSIYKNNLTRTMRLIILLSVVFLITLLSVIAGCSKNNADLIPEENSSVSADNKNIRIISSLQLDNCTKVLVKDEYVFAIDGYYGLVIIDIRNKEKPEIIKSIFTPCPNDICIADNYLYIADYNRGLLIADISDAENTEIIKEISKPNQSFSIYCHGDLLFFANQNTYAEKNTVIL